MASPKPGGSNPKKLPMVKKNPPAPHGDPRPVKPKLPLKGKMKNGIK
jgi:hypothetical protein